MKWSSEPALLSLPVREASGERFDAVPEDYLRWIVEGQKLREEIKASARYWLEKRATPAPQMSAPSQS